MCRPRDVNEVLEPANEEQKHELKDDVKEETPKGKLRRIECNKITKNLKEASVKTYRYTRKSCGGQLSEKPVKPHTIPRPKQVTSNK